jgi:type IV pilus assembly protein PilF
MKIRIITGIVMCALLFSCASEQTKLQRSREKDPKYQYDIGTVYLGNSRADDAISHFSSSMRLDPNFFLAYNGIGLAYMMKGQFDIAEKYFLKCLEVKPDFTEARNNLGMVYQETEQLDKAERQFRIASEDMTYSSRHLAYYNLARLYYLQEKDQEALDCVQTAVKMSTEFGLGYHLQGVLYNKRGQYEDAINSYKRAQKIIRDDVNLNYNLGEAYFNNKQMARAQRIFEEIYPNVTDVEMKTKIDEYLKAIKKLNGGGTS